MGLKHLFQSAKADAADPTVVQPSDWNADHEATWQDGAAAMTSYSVDASLGNGTLRHRYIQIGKLIIVEFELETGSTTTWGTGGGRISDFLPVAQATTNARLNFPVTSLTHSTNGTVPLTARVSGTQIIDLYNASGGGLTGAPGAGIHYTAFLTYEAA